MVAAESLSLAAFAFAAGAATFLAPCAYPLLPGYVSYFLGQHPGDDAPPPLHRAVVVGALVSLGFVLVYAVLAGLAVRVGARALADISVLELVVGLLLVGLGTAMATGWKPATPTLQLPARRRSALGFVGFGVVYAAAAAGCTAPIFVAVALRALAGGPTATLLTFGAYAAGMTALMVAVTLAAALGREAILRRLTGNLDRVHRAAGVLLVLAGLVQLYYYLVVFDGLAHLTG